MAEASSKDRTVHAIEVPYTEQEKQIHRQLQEYARIVLNRGAETTEHLATDFVLTESRKIEGQHGSKKKAGVTQERERQFGSAHSLQAASQGRLGVR